MAGKGRRPTPAIHTALYAGTVEAVRAALATGAEVDDEDRDGRTALEYAAADGRADLVDLLLRAGARPDHADRRGRTALHFAAQAHAPGICETLLAAGAPVDAVDAHGNTPLSTAVFESRGRGEVITLLLRHGADRHLKNAHGVSPASLAASIGNYDVKRWLV